jgi:Spy/CpxP family protein refolding chaperone
MNTSERRTGVAQTLFRRLRSRAVIATLLGGIAITAGVVAFAQGHDARGWHHGSAMTAQDHAAHVDQMLQHAYIEIGATDAQKAQLDPIVKQAANDLMPLHTQFRDSHEQLKALYTQDRIDRVAIETIRADNMRAADQASQRITQLLLDVGDALTPAQRKTLVELVAKHHGGGHG